MYKRTCNKCNQQYKVPSKNYNTNKYYCSWTCYCQSRVGVPKKEVRYSYGYRYLFMPEHPDSAKQGYIAEHRLVAEKKINRRILPSEIVHHINGKRDDNRPENLMVCSRQEHNQEHGFADTLLSPENKEKNRIKVIEYHNKRLVDWNCQNCGFLKKKTAFQAKYRKYCGRRCLYQSMNKQDHFRKMQKVQISNSID